jgi:UDP-3-O-[3-hydroxymyristoyl] glucosamine N-acyltransferase
MFASEIALAIGGRLIGDNVRCARLSPLYCAALDDLSILAWSQDIRLAKKASFGALLISSDWAADYLLEIDGPLIVIEDFFSAFSTLRSLLDAGLLQDEPKLENAAISPLARLSPHARVGCAIIGEHSVIEAGVVIEDQVSIGRGCHIKAGAVIHGGTTIANDVVIGANTVVASQAFAPYGFETIKNLPSLGSVVIEEGVRVGALCTIDRGLIGRTRIKKNTLLDNMVHIGHDVVVGEQVIIAAQTALAGFVQVENSVTLGGQVGLAPHAVIGQGARISAKSLVRGKVDAYEIRSGNPSLPHRIYLKDYAQKIRQSR